MQLVHYERNRCAISSKHDGTKTLRDLRFLKKWIKFRRFCQKKMKWREAKDYLKECGRCEVDWGRKNSGHEMFGSFENSVA